MARCFKNYKGQFFIYKSRITKAETKFKVVRNFESQFLSHLIDGSIAKSFKSTLVAKIVKSLSQDKILHLLLDNFTCEICCLSANDL